MRSFLTLGVAIAALSTTSALAIPAIQGPSSSATPYLTPIAKGWSAHSIISAGDTAANGYALVGVPDGLGAFDNGDGTITILATHELRGDLGGPRAHGAPSGAFVSQWVIDKNTLAVSFGQDLATSLVTAGGTDLEKIINRLCSADLPEVSAFYNAASGKGYNGYIFMNGEETGPAGRAFGFVVAERTGYELPALAKFSWENSVANPGTGDRTMVMGTDDSTTGALYLYLGEKQANGTSVEKAGLTNGQSFIIQLRDAANNPLLAEDRLTGFGTIDSAALVKQTVAFDLVLNDGVNTGTDFLRPEDFHWDPKNPNVGYFATTDRYDQVKDGSGPQVGRSRLYRIVFDDVNAANPTGKIEMLLDGTEDFQMLDNLTVGDDGMVYLQEDPGGNARSARILAYDPTTGALQEIFKHDASRFGDRVLVGGVWTNIAATLPFNNNEEASGIIDVTDLFRGSDLDFGGRNKFFLVSDQAHYGLPSPIVEGGQLALLIQAPEPGMFALFGLGVVGAMAARRRRR